ncbi:hypothetical protein HK104_009627 [Borealophlyctis nickersoniae]|nr:hypothetical protein HK104_009627 [Borealophlyctis nickersoniae]
MSLSYPTPPQLNAPHNGQTPQQHQHHQLQKRPSDQPQPQQQQPQQQDDNANLGRLIQEERAKGSLSLNLGQRNLTQLPPEIGMLLELERLGLSNNLLHSLPPELGKLAHLRYLNLRSNQFREFPPAICELPRLEILDISRNKIKRLPPKFGKLMNLKVLGMSKNRIQQLPAYIGYMSELKVLKIEGNPIQWPPPDIIQCSSQDEREREVWLKALKEFMLREVAADGRSDPKAGVKREEHDRGPASSRNWKDRILNGVFFRDDRNQDCDILVDMYLREIRPSTVTEGEDLDTRVVEIARGVACALGGLYRTARRLAAASADRGVAKTVERDLRELNGRTSKLVSVLRAMDGGSGSMTPVERSNQTPEQRVAEVKRVVLAATGDARRVVELVQEHLKPLLQGVDPRVSRTLIVGWYGASAELATALQSAAGNAAPGRPQSPTLSAREGGSSEVGEDTVSEGGGGTGSAASRSGEGSAGGHVVDVETVLTLARSAVNASTEILKVLQRLPEQLRRRGSEPDSGGKSMEGGDGDLSSLIEGARIATHTLAETLDIAQGEREDTKQRKNVYEDAGVFIKAVIHLSTGARTLATSRTFDKPTMAGLQHVTRATKELAMALATHGHGTRPTPPTSDAGSPSASEPPAVKTTKATSPSVTVSTGSPRRNGKGSAGVTSPLVVAHVEELRANLLDRFNRMI